MNICTRCGKVFNYPTSVSRVDNVSPVCRVCSAKEALDVSNVSIEEKERVLSEISAHENG